MSKTYDGARIVVEMGYHKFLLPKEASADQLSILVDAIPLESIYASGKNYLCAEEKGGRRIEMSIVKSNDIRDFVDARNDKQVEYDIIIEEVKKRIGPNHRTIVFRSDSITSGEEEFKYADLANPEVDPESIIEDILAAALKEKS